MPKEDSMTIDELARIMQSEFHSIYDELRSVHEGIATLREETQHSFDALKEDIREIKQVHQMEMTRRIERLKEAVYHR